MLKRRLSPDRFRVTLGTEIPLRGRFRRQSETPSSFWRPGVGRSRPPKTANGGRTISVDRTELGTIRLQVDHEASSRGIARDRLVQVSLVGTSVRAQNVMRRFKRLRARAGLPEEGAATSADDADQGAVRRYLEMRAVPVGWPACVLGGNTAHGTSESSCTPRLAVRDLVPRGRVELPTKGL